MRYKKIIITGILILMTVFSSACGSSGDGKNVSEETQNTQSEVSSVEDKPETIQPEDTNSEEKNLYGEKTLDEIREDLEKSGLIQTEFGTDEEYHVENVELIKRNTTESTDDVYCTLTVNSDSHSIIQSYELVYNHYTTGGWILDEYIEDGERSCLPLMGVDEFTVGYDVSQNFGDGCDYEITDQKTDLESMSDSVSVRVAMDGTLFKASGQVAFHYSYDNSGWNLVECVKESGYTESYDFTGAWVCDYTGNGDRIRLFLVRTQDGDSITGDYIQMQVYQSTNKINIIEEFVGNPFTVMENGSVFWESQGYEKFYYDKNTVMETDHTPFAKYSDSYMTVDEYIAENYPGYSVQR